MLAIMSKPFTNWLLEELEKQKMSPAELARRSGLSRTAISNYINEQRYPNSAALEAIAHALGYPAETVYRAAGILPPTSDADEEARQLIFLFQNASPERRAELLRYAQFLAEQEQKQNSKDTTQTLKTKTQLR